MIIPDFPNFFILAGNSSQRFDVSNLIMYPGPNTTTGYTSVLFFEETQVRIFLVSFQYVIKAVQTHRLRTLANLLRLS